MLSSKLASPVTCSKGLKKLYNKRACIARNGELMARPFCFEAIVDGMPVAGAYFRVCAWHSDGQIFPVLQN